MTIVYPLYPVLLDGVQGAKSNLFPFSTPYVILRCSNIDKVKGIASTRFISLTLIRSSLGNPLTCIYCLISYDFSHHIRAEIDFACFEVSIAEQPKAFISLRQLSLFRLYTPSLAFGVFVHSQRSLLTLCSELCLRSCTNNNCFLIILL